MATSQQKTVLAIVLATVGAIAPAFFGYLQATQETREKYRQSRKEASNGYEVLVTSVKSLQTTVTEQHDYIVKLQGQVDLLTRVLSTSAGLRMTGTGTGSGSGSGSTDVPVAAADLPKLDAPPDLPPLPAPPPTFATAQMAR